MKVLIPLYGGLEEKLPPYLPKQGEMLVQRALAKVPGEGKPSPGFRLEVYGVAMLKTFDQVDEPPAL